MRIILVDNKPIPIYYMNFIPIYGPSVYFGGPFNIKFTNTVYIKP